MTFLLHLSCPLLAEHILIWNSKDNNSKPDFSEVVLSPSPVRELCKQILPCAMQLSGLDLRHTIFYITQELPPNQSPRTKEQINESIELLLQCDTTKNRY